MTTRSELITSILSSLHSYTGLHEQVVALANPLTDSALTVSCTSSDAARRGIAEIDEELIYVDSVSGNDLALPPFGRGYRGSVATSHAAGAMVTLDPAFPRVEVGRAIDQVVAGLFPKLYQVKETTLDSQVTDVSYALPTDVEHVLRVEAKVAGDPSDYWNPLVEWELEKSTTTPQLNLCAGPGWSIRVVYAARFGALDTDLATSGIPESYEDILVYLVTSRMIRFLEPARLQLGSVENVSRANVVQSGDAGKTATQLYALGQQRIAEERRLLIEAFPPRPNYLSR